jgi:hypothetical protein
MSDEEENLGPAEVMRRWHLSGDHPESWVQRNATYREIYAQAYAAGYAQAREDAAMVAEAHLSSPLYPQSALETFPAPLLFNGLYIFRMMNGSTWCCELHPPDSPLSLAFSPSRDAASEKPSRSRRKT